MPLDEFDEPCEPIGFLEALTAEIIVPSGVIADHRDFARAAKRRACHGVIRGAGPRGRVRCDLHKAVDDDS